MVKVFIDHEHVIKVINLLTEFGISGFYLYEYQGMSPRAWKNFRLKEDPDMTIETIKNHSEPGVIVNTVVRTDRCEQLIQFLEQGLKGIRFTIIGHQVRSIKVRGD
ncbi:MAG TPA: MJ1244 family protein [Methanotrichaceae archaeon]|nr:MJ1244 family protein [Methanotrichaceae archaeon]HQI92054.1 MJ1244 family protein [Methanotrichaceae archaeon]